MARCGIEWTWLFARSEGGDGASAVSLSLTEIVRLNSVELHAYLCARAHQPASRRQARRELLRFNWKAGSAVAQCAATWLHNCQLK